MRTESPRDFTRDPRRTSRTVHRELAIVERHLARSSSDLCFPGRNADKEGYNLPRNPSEGGRFKLDLKTEETPAKKSLEADG